MQISQMGLNLIKHFEGFSATPYQDMVGVWTIGYGHTGPGTESMGPLTEAEGQALLLSDLARFEAGVSELVKVALQQCQFDALCSFTYNLGLESLQISTLLKLLNEGDYAGASLQFVEWDHAGGKVVEGLLLRREAETQLFDGQTPDCLANSASSLWCNMVSKVKMLFKMS